MMKTKIYILIFLLFALIQACATDDLGTCTILKSGDDLVFTDMSIDECQDIFLETRGARGWKWEPNN